jgi:predicted Rossmann fold flavoprotein
VAIVGGGAAGLATSIFTRRLNRDLSVALLDGAKRLGAKILVSGGTRCNVTNAVVTERDFSGGKRAVVRRILKSFSASQARDFFQQIGVSLHEEAGGKLFPDSNRARDVLNALLGEATRVGVAMYADHRVTEIERDGEAFVVRTSRGAMRARHAVLATGGLSLPKSGSDGFGYNLATHLGHTLVTTTPALVPLTLGTPSIHYDLSGVSHVVELTLWVNGAKAVAVTGSMLWTHTGISGPAALDISRHVARARADGASVRLTANFWGGGRFDDVDAELQRTGRVTPKALARTVLALRLPAALADAVLGEVGIDRDAPLSQLPRDARRALTHAIVEWPMPVTGTRGYNFAEVTAGGVALEEIDPATMMSRVCPGVWLVGEILDVDGRLGGFNFQWAWSTAYVAARSLAATDPDSNAPLG